ncbi:hypothetical protein [Nocardioides aquiterrae]|uniref:Uncharacterized protein n=1 Tax=Nocardioides aquiterrae TaxID=203799 RepID=A0ABN1U6K4_9ACTN
MSEEDQIRRLLADARHDEPIPPDVAGRLDGVLADLRADRPVRPVVTDLAAARRRRRVRTLLVAAAAVVVAGIGVDQLRGADLSGGGDAAGGSATSNERPEIASQDGAGGGSASSAEAPVPGQAGAAVRLDSDRFTRQVARLQGDVRAALNATTDTRLLYSYKSARCRAPGSGRKVPVTYDGAPGVLVFRPPTRDSQVVDLILCGHEGITRTITLPAP